MLGLDIVLVGDNFMNIQWITMNIHEYPIWMFEVIFFCIIQLSYISVVLPNQLKRCENIIYMEMTVAP